MRSHQIKIAVAWGDCDPAQIVFYPRYFEWFDHATHQLLESIGMSHQQMAKRWNAVGLSLVDAQATFHRPASYGDRLQVSSQLSAIGRSSLTVSHIIRRGSDQLVTGQEVRVWIKRDTQGVLKSAPIPAEVRQLMTGG